MPRLPFVFVRNGDPPPLTWMARHPGWIKIPAVMIPRNSPNHPANGAPYPNFSSPFPAPAPVANEPEAEEFPFGAAISHTLRGRSSRITPGNPPQYPGGHGAPLGTHPGQGEDPVAVFLRMNTVFERMGASARPGGEERGRRNIDATSSATDAAALRPGAIENRSRHLTIQAPPPDTGPATGTDPAVAPIEPVAYYTRNAGNTTAKELGVTRYQLRDAIHALKDRYTVAGDEDILIHIPSGDVLFTGEVIGNVNDA